MVTKRTAGRPDGVKDPIAHERIRRRLHKIYDALLHNAETGDAAAASLCFDICKNPDKYPIPSKETPR